VKLGAGSLLFFFFPTKRVLFAMFAREEGIPRLFYSDESSRVSLTPSLFLPRRRGSTFSLLRKASKPSEMEEEIFSFHRETISIGTESFSSAALGPPSGKEAGFFSLWRVMMLPAGKGLFPPLNGLFRGEHSPPLRG